MWTGSNSISSSPKNDPRPDSRLPEPPWTPLCENRYSSCIKAAVYVWELFRKRNQATGTKHDQGSGSQTRRNPECPFRGCSPSCPFRAPRRCRRGRFSPTSPLLPRLKLSLKGFRAISNTHYYHGRALYSSSSESCEKDGTRRKNY